MIPDAKRNLSIAGIDNYLYVVYTTKLEIPHTLKFCRSTNDGVTWEGYYEVADAIYNLPEPSITADNDSIRLVFRQGSYIVYTASGDHGNSWSPFDIIDAGGPYPECCPDITTFNNKPHVVFVSNEVSLAWEIGYIFYATPSAQGWYTTCILVDPWNQIFYYPHIALDQQGYIYAICEDTLRGPNTGHIRCFASTDGGEHWDTGTLGVNEIEGSDFLIAGTNRLFAVCGDANYVYGCYGNYSPGVGFDWESPFILEDISPVEPPACKPHCCIVKGNIAKHLIFHIGYGNNQDLAYMANDDLLLSDTPEATAFNSANHLVRDIFSGTLHLVYQSQGRVHYSFSNDGGETWSPYHILEDPQSQQKEYGRYPSVGLVPGFFASNPCVVFIDNENQVKYRYRDLSGEWQGFTILPSVGLEPGPPAVATYGGDVFVAFSVMNWVGGEDYVSAVLFYQFNATATEPPEPYIIDQADDGTLYGSNVAITIDGNGDPHVVWSKKLAPDRPEDIFYRWRTDGNWQDIENISRQDDAPSTYPHLDDHGNYLAVVWHYDGDYEIWRREKDIPNNRWEDGGGYSQPYAVCAYPVNAAVDFSVWCEAPIDQFDIRYRSETYGYGWVSQASENEYFCHSYLQRDWYPWDLYTIFTKGDATPYQIVCVHQQFGDAPPGSESPLYIVETGKNTPSAFCRQRDGIINYSNCSVDYANSELIYDLCLLDPAFPFHKVKGTAYFEGNSNRTYELWINGVKKHTLTIKPNESYDFEVLIPNDLYRDAHRITFSIKNPNSTGVALAGIKVYRKVDEKGGGGPQSLRDSKYSPHNQLVAFPNPFSQETSIKLQITDNNQKISLKVYDATGRVVKTFNKIRNKSDTSAHSLLWSGFDDNGKQLPAGIHFVELKSGNQSMTEKVIKLK
ncbi:MAG: T9SS type A sorting domain-containing protein [candidate division WOR-3 bacterium]